MYIKLLKPDSSGNYFRCQVCPECLEWKDPNENIAEVTLGTDISTSSTPTCYNTTNCPVLANCEIERIYRSENGTTCRGENHC